MAEFYDTDRFAQLHQLSQNPQDESLALAVAFLDQKLRPIHVVVMGGFSMRLRGSDRATMDVDVTVDCTMNKVIEKLRNEERVCFPLNRRSDALVLPTFVRTGGGKYPEKIVHVDIIFNGNLNSPVYPDGVDTIKTNLAPLPKVQIIQVWFLVHAKLEMYHNSNGMQRKALVDLNFLMSKYSDFISSHSADFKEAHRKTYLRGYAAGNIDDLIWMSGVLKLPTPVDPRKSTYVEITGESTRKGIMGYDCLKADGSTTWMGQDRWVKTLVPSVVPSDNKNFSGLFDCYSRTSREKAIFYTYDLKFGKRKGPSSAGSSGTQSYSYQAAAGPSAIMPYAMTTSPSTQSYPYQAAAGPSGIMPYGITTSPSTQPYSYQPAAGPGVIMPYITTGETTQTVGMDQDTWESEGESEENEAEEAGQGLSSGAIFVNVTRKVKTHIFGKDETLYCFKVRETSRETSRKDWRKTTTLYEQEVKDCVVYRTKDHEYWTWELPKDKGKGKGK